ncbi:MAG: sulfatase [Myxococcota bacterium]
MPTRRAVWIAAVLAALALAIEGGDRLRRRQGGGPARFDRVVLVTIDALRADHVGSYGYRRPTTPFLDRLAERGARFEAAFSPCPVTNPSHASMLTGLFPHRHGVLSNRHRLDASLPSLARRLRSQGFDTAAFASVSFLESLNSGFYRFDARLRPGSETVNAAIDWLKSERNSERFFLWVHLYDVHEWWRMDWANPSLPIEVKTSIPGDVRPYMSSLHGWPTPFLAKWVLHGGREITSLVEALEIIDDYDARLLYADGQIERLYQAVEETPGGGETLWIVTSDHGEGLGGHGYLTHGVNLHDEQLRVPLIVSGNEGSIPPAVIDSLVSLVDLPATVLELTVADAGAAWGDGRSLASLLLGRRRETQRDRVAFAERAAYAAWMEKFGAVEENVHAAFDGRHKLILHGRGSDEVYDLLADPMETQNLRDAPPHLASFLGQISSERVRESQPAPELPAHIEAELQALGYVE